MRRLRVFSVVTALFMSLLASAASEIRLSDVDGKSRAVSEFIGRGQWTVVTVWSVDCLICQRDLPQVAFFHDAHRKKDARVLGVSVDGIAERARVEKFIDEYALNFPILIGTPADVARFGGKSFRGTPTFLFFAPDGRLVGEHVGAMTLVDMEWVLVSAPR